MDVARSFSEELIENRTFEIGGELFEWTYPHWEVTAKLWDGDDQREETTEPENGKPAFSFRADTEYAIKNMPIFLNPKNEAHKRWKALVVRKTDPVPRHQIIALYRWLYEVTSGLPTTPPSPLEGGGGDTEISSPEESS